MIIAIVHYIIVIATNLKLRYFLCSSFFLGLCVCMHYQSCILNVRNTHSFWAHKNVSVLDITVKLYYIRTIMHSSQCEMLVTSIGTLLTV